MPVAKKSLNVPQVYRNHFNTFLSFMESTNAPANTIRNYSNYVSTFFNWVANNKDSCPIEDIPWEYYREYEKWLQDTKGLKGNTVNQHMCALRKFYEGVMELEWNAKAVPKVKYEQFRGAVPSEKELDIILSSTTAINHLLEFEFMGYCGLRISELVALTYSDIRRERGTLYVKPSKNHEDREVPLPTEMLAQIERYYRMLPQPRPGKSDYIFPGRVEGTHITTTTIENHLNAVIQKLGWEDRHYTCHSLRRAFGCEQYLAHPDDLPRLASIMGHRSISSTMIYIRSAAAFKAMAEDNERINARIRRINQTCK